MEVFTHDLLIYKQKQIQAGSTGVEVKCQEQAYNDSSYEK